MDNHAMGWSCLLGRTADRQLRGVKPTWTRLLPAQLSDQS
jgi:hypothetical protein